MAPPLQSMARGPLHRPTLPTFLLPFLHLGTRRHKSILSNLQNVRSSYGHVKRLGRGPASGKGKTAGRGENGQKKKSGTPFVSSLGVPFAGGQTMLTQKQRGFFNFFHRDLQTVNLSKLTSWIAQKRIDPTRPITPRELYQSRCINTPKEGIKLLATGKETLPPDTPLNIMVSRASASAIAAVEALGGRVQTRYYTHNALRQVVRGKMDPVHSLQSTFDEKVWGPRWRVGEAHRLPDPVQRREREYYRDPAKRGYLMHEVVDGAGPSLFFRKPGQVARNEDGSVVERKKRDVKKDMNRIW